MKTINIQSINITRRMALLACGCFLLACLPARATLLLHYLFDDYTNATFTVDSSADPTNGFFSGSATRVASTPNGAPGYSLNVMGNNNAVQNWLTVSNCAKLNPSVGFITNMTITFWMNLQGNPGASDRVLSKEISSPVSGFGVQIYGPGSTAPTADKFSLSFGANSLAGIAKTTTTANASNRWIFCAVTYDGTKPKGTTGYQNVFWYQGSPNSPVAPWGTPYVANNGYITNTTAHLRIGSTPASGSDRTPPAWFKDVQIHDTVLSQGQIEAIRQGQADPSVLVSVSSASVFPGTNVTFTATTIGLGEQTPAYQWWFMDTPINGATDSTYSISSVQMSDAGLYGCTVSNNVATPPITNASTILQVNALPYNPAVLSLVWSLPYSQINYLNGYAMDRSMTYNAFSSKLILCHRAANPFVAVLDPLTGSFESSLDESALINGGYTGSFAVNQVAAAEDGVIYGGNMTLEPATTPYALYRWQTESASQTLAYTGDPGAPNYPNLRWGDTLIARGSGATTQLLLSSGDANSNSTDTVFCLLTTTDGVNFSSQAFMVTNIPGASANVGLAWGPGTDTFFAKSPGFTSTTTTNQYGLTYTDHHYTNETYYVQFDANLGIGWALQKYGTNAVAGKTGPLGSSLSSNLLAGLEVSTNPDYGYDYVSLYNIADPLVDPVLLGQSITAYNKQNGPYGGVGSLNFGRINGTNYLFVLDTQNGIFTYSINADNFTPPAYPPAITGISPVTGRTNGNTLVTITGSNFLPGASVTFGGSAGTGVALKGSTSLTVYAPPGAPGAVDVVVRNTNNLFGTSVNGFTYILPPPEPFIVPNSIVQSGSSLSMTWIGGTNAACELLSATNLNPPVIWSTIQTNHVGADGLFTNTVTINPARGAEFFRLAIPYN